MLRPRQQARRGELIDFFGTDADRHEDISRNGSSGFGGSADSAETDLTVSSLTRRISRKRPA
jgi:hypothetical protein